MPPRFLDREKKRDLYRRRVSLSQGRRKKRHIFYPQPFFSPTLAPVLLPHVIAGRHGDIITFCSVFVVRKKKYKVVSQQQLQLGGMLQYIVTEP